MPTPRPPSLPNLTPSEQAAYAGGLPWLNQVERGFAELTRKQLQRRVHRSTRQLEDESAPLSTTTTGTQNPSGG